MKTTCISAMIGVLVVLIITPVHSAERTETLRARVVNSTQPYESGRSCQNITRPYEAGRAYQAYFQRIGLAGLRGLLLDADTGIALQAAWEIHKKPSRRLVRFYSDDMEVDVYDRDELIKFRDFLAKRTKAPIPGWWSSAITNIVFAPGERHGMSCEDWPDHQESKAGSFAFDRIEVQSKQNQTRFGTGNRAIDLSTLAFEDHLLDTYAGLIRENQTFVGRYSSSGCGGGKLAAFRPGQTKPIWVSDFWASAQGMLAGMGFHRFELMEKDGTVFVFGAATGGTYLEAFDTLSGNCKYRFCCSYWCNPSETWWVDDKNAMPEVSEGQD